MRASRAGPGPSGNVVITGGNTPYVLAKWGVPFIVGTTGTMANNGAVTWGTALPNAYLGGAWVVMPAGSIAAGVPAATATLWYVGATTTTGTFFNSTYTSGVPVVGTQTAFATTGPGAFAGITAQVTGPVITIPAGALLANGRISSDAAFNFTSSVNNKTVGALVNAVDYAGFTNASTGGAVIMTRIYNKGVTNAQAGASTQLTGGGAAVGSWHYDTADFTAQQTFTYKFARATATENMVMENGEIQVAQ